MSDPSDQLPPIYDADDPSEESNRLDAIFDDLEIKQIDTLDEASNGLIERIAIFNGVHFGVTVLSNTFPPPDHKGDLPAKIVITIALTCFLSSVGAASVSIRVRTYRRYIHNVTETAKELQRMLQHKLTWQHTADLMFALGAIALAVLLLIIVWTL